LVCPGAWPKISRTLKAKLFCKQYVHTAEMKGNKTSLKESTPVNLALWSDFYVI